MSSFSTSLAGLDADSADLNVISNNLANLNTTGYKDQTPAFQDLFYQQLGLDGAGNPVQVGVGSSIGSVSTNFTDGSTQNTGVPTDEAIQGNGFFVVQQPNGQQVYTRDGTFSVNTSGFLVSSQGGQVMGYPAVNGTISQTLAPLSVSNGQTSPPVATGNVSLTMNLDASAAVSTATPPPVSFSTSTEVYDSLGASHVLTFNFTKTAATSTSSTWSYQVTAPAADVGQTGAPVTVGSGTLDFNASGVLTNPAAGSPPQMSLTGLSDGAGNLTVNWNLYDSSGNPLVTQVAGTSAASASNQDGYAGGTLLSFSVAQDGTIEGSFSNGQTTALGQLALANFSNPQGLTLNGGNTYAATFASGVPNIGAAATGGRGTILGGALEESNVDVATEFANLITAQSDYQANARAITVADDVTQTALNMVQQQ